MDLPSPKNHTTWDRSPFFRALRFTRPRADPADLDLNVSFHDFEIQWSTKILWSTRFKIKITIWCVMCYDSMWQDLTTWIVIKLYDDTKLWCQDLSPWSVTKTLMSRFMMWWCQQNFNNKNFMTWFDLMMCYSISWFQFYDVMMSTNFNDQQISWSRFDSMY